jgi:lipid-binding SYLF domain-containing protein
MKRFFGVVLLAGLVGAPVATRAADTADKQKLDERLASAQETIESVMGQKDGAIPDSIARKAYCVAVVPGLVKGAFIVGAEYGQGVATCRTSHGWSGPVFIRMAGGSWGFQVGGKGTDLVLLAVNKKGMENLLQSHFKIGADASAAAGPLGRSGEAATDLSMKSEMLAYSRAHGLFAGVDLSGVTVSQNATDTNGFYGNYHDFDTILNGKVSAPAGSNAFLHTISQYFGEVTPDEREHRQVVDKPTNNMPSGQH